MRIKSLFLIAIVAIFTLQACKSNQNLQSGNKPRKGWKHTLANADMERPDFETLTLNGKAEVRMPAQGMRIGASYRINIAKDSLIWIRMSKFGIEAVRVLITQDSIFVLDKLSNSLRVTDFSLAERYTGLEGNFGALQDLILGNLYLIPEKMSAEKKKGNPHIFTGSQAGMDFRYTIDTDIYKVLEIEAQNSGQNQHSLIKYEDFKEAGTSRIATKGALSVIAPTETGVKFNHSKVEVNPNKISFKFTVPASYERISN